MWWLDKSLSSSPQNPLATPRQTPRDPDFGRDVRLGTTDIQDCDGET
jgi:hypothetical protein